MSREIKFKFYEKDALTRKWRVMLEVRACGGINNFFMREGMEKCQFTGLKDKNGREIFEGDIVCLVQAEYAGCDKRGEDIFNHVKYLREIRIGEYEVIAGYDVTEERYGTHGKYKGSSYDTSPACLRRCSIVGNIFENPELLKNTKPEIQ